MDVEERQRRSPVLHQLQHLLAGHGDFRKRDRSGHLGIALGHGIHAAAEPEQEVRRGWCLPLGRIVSSEHQWPACEALPRLT